MKIKSISKTLLSVGAVIALVLTLFVGGFALIANNSNPKQQVEAAGLIDYTARSDGSGTGNTAADPYIIGSKETMRSLLASNAATAGKFYALQRNIDMTGMNWTTLNTFALNSVFDGNGLEINNFTSTGSTYAGLFNTFLGEIKNVTFNNLTLTGTSSTYVGLLGASPSGTYTGTAKITNVNIASGNINGGGSSSRTGGFFGYVNGFNGTSATSRFVTNITNCYVKATIMGGNCTGSLVGYFSSSSNTDWNIKNCFFEGSIDSTSNIVGGIVGASGSGTSRTINIEDCYVIGTLRAGGSYCGGILGYSAAAVGVNIKNCYVSARITSTTAPVGGLVGGASSTSYGVGIYILNSYFNSTLFTGAGAGQYVPVDNQTNPPGQNQGQPSGVISSPVFVDWLNNGVTPPVWVWTTNGPGLVSNSGFATTVVLLEANGGKFAGDEDRVEVQFTIDEDWSKVTVPEDPTRIGYDFAGYNTLADGTGTQYDSATDVPYNGQTTVYAQWTKIGYMVDVVETTIGNQTISFYNDATTPHTLIDSITIDQQGYIWTYLDAPGEDVFSSFMVLKKEEWNNGSYTNDSANWVNLGAGESYFYSGTYNGQRLFFENLIDNEFIENYAINDNGTRRFVFKAVYDTVAPNQITVTTSLPALGTLKIDGLARPFGITMSYSVSRAEPVEIEATPILYRKFVRFDIYVGGTFIESRTTQTTLVAIQDNMEIKVIFANQDYDVYLISKSGATTLSTQTITDGISLNSGYTSGQLLEYVDDPIDPTNIRHKIVSNNVENYKIFNKQTGKYDYFNAGSRVVSINNISVNEAYFEKYLTLDGKLEIIVEYTRQFKFDFSITNGQRGEVTMKISSPNGGSYPVDIGESNVSLEPYYDEGTVFTITCKPNIDSRLANMPTLLPGELNGRVITLNLTSARSIAVVFEAADFNFTYFAYKKSGEAIEVITDGTIASVTPSATGQIALDQTISASKTNSSEYSFVGWYTLVRGELKLYSRGDSGDDYNLPALTFNTAFIRDYADGYNVVLVALFAKISSVDIAVSDDTMGKFNIEVYTYDDINGTWFWDSQAVSQTSYYANHDANTLIKISFLPSEFYKLSSLDGLDIIADTNVDGNVLRIEEINYAENYVIIRVNGIRAVTIDFEKERYTIIDAGNNLSKAKGSVQANKTEIGLGDTVVLTFSAKGGYQLSTWTVNDQSLAVVSKRGDTLSFTVTEDWLRENVDLINNTVDLSSTISTTMNQTYMIALFTTLGAVPVLVIALCAMFVMNKKKKTQYKAALERSKKMEFGLNQQEFIKNIRGE